MDAYLIAIVLVLDQGLLALLLSSRNQAASVLEAMLGTKSLQFGDLGLAAMC